VRRGRACGLSLPGRRWRSGEGSADGGEGGDHGDGGRLRDG
jgi:hypothetical protein